ncbi:UNVERIFIED_CONTAM: hypothetical protein RMT77_006807 [Armadillidium vulgare]
MPKPKLEKSKSKKRKRRLKSLRRNVEDSSTKGVENMFASSSSTGAKPKAKIKKKRIKKKTLSKLIDSRNWFAKPGGPFKEGENKLFTVRRIDELSKPKDMAKTASKRRRKKTHSKGVKKMSDETRLRENIENKMAAESSGTNERVQKHSENKGRIRKKPRSLPPLPRTPKSPVARTPRNSAELESVRRFIGSPPPPVLANMDHIGDIQTIKSCWRSSDDLKALPDEEGPEFTVYAPVRNLSQSQPKITLNIAPDSSKSVDDEAIYETTVINANPSSQKSSANSMSSLIKSTSSLNLNSSLMLPPKLLSYVAEDGSPAVQEFVPEERSQSAVSRRSSTPSIRDLPSPLTGVSPLEVHPKRSLQSRLSKVQLSPLPKR